ncbi:MAG TPA: RNA polymerase sigma factor [Casimicrobiaceae bacterium]|nr:RNA polymerase sigma factor [Casimicrobiaceae bacterium]
MGNLVRACRVGDQPNAVPMEVVGPALVRNPSSATLPGSASAAAGLPEGDLVDAIPRLRRYARVLTGDPTRADDLVQDTLARAWDKRGLWRRGSDLRAWLFTIMHNVHLNQRAVARREATNISLDSEDEYSASLQVAEYGNQLDRIELLEVVQQVSRLPAEQREVLLLVAVEGLRYEEVATVLAIPVGTVMSRLSRARDRLRRGAIEPPSRSLGRAGRQGV